ncbi:MAG: hypothetical protein DWQ08_13435 [Proteobacteria bacterium]|nr:MAG: hypothetical protein DWQ08_13435 [Pseudomonadota bacterium]
MGDTNNSLEQIDAAIRNRDLSRAQALLEAFNRNPARRTLDTLLRYAYVLEARQQFGEAASAFEIAEAHATQPADKVHILNRISDLIYLQHKDKISRSDLARMASFLERSVALDATAPNASAMIKLCNLYKTIDDIDGLMKQSTRLAALPDYFPEAQLWLATAYQQLGDRPRGLAHLEQAKSSVARLDKRQLLWLLSLLVQFRAFGPAQELLDICRERQFKDELLLELQAQVYFETQDTQGVLDIATEATAAGCTDSATARRLYYYRGKALEEVGKFTEAFESFQRMNDIARRMYAPTDETDIVQAWRDVEPDTIPSFPAVEQLPYHHVFMVAFPRSGTTLLETILDTHPQISTLSEVDTLLEIRREIERLGIVYPAGLSTLTHERVASLRKIYMDATKKYLDDTAHCSVVIDKLPLNILHLPLIRMLFPDARFILSLRHPLDVCLSCFQQDFLLNNEMALFTNLEGCFTRYRDVMMLFENFRDKLDLDLHTVRYEDLVEDFEGTATGVFDFLGIRPDDSYRSFHTVNQEKLINTPSRSQVVRPLYQSSRFKWQHYWQYLQPHVHHIRALIDTYGYPEPDGPADGL